jgi:mRNA interferase HigB
MKVLNKRLINNFADSHADARDPLSAWVNEVEDAEWEQPLDIRGRYPSVSILGGREYVFNIKGNSYRLHAKVDFESKTLFVAKIGTHDEYDKWQL